MRKAKTLLCGSVRRVLLALIGFLFLMAIHRFRFTIEPKPLVWHVDTSHKQLAHSYVRSILAGQCRPAFARQELEARSVGSARVSAPFLWHKAVAPAPVFRYPPPFGFRGLRDQLADVLGLLPAPPEEGPAPHHGARCQRCVVVGNGGVLRGLELGPLIDRFDVVIRLNSGPVRDFSRDVGNRTSIRMSYPEGSPRVWEDVDPELRFVTVVYKAADFSWLKAMIKKEAVSVWNWLFFWQKVPDQIPVALSQFRILNPEIIRETALDLLKYPTPQFRLWGWDKNVPTLGISALNLATYLCDEVSIAGFGYDLGQQEAPLHYYDGLPMTAMLKQPMHDVDRERAFLQVLVASGSVADLTGGVHCSFCVS